MAVETAHVDRTGITGIPAFRPNQVGVRHGRDQAALGSAPQLAIEADAIILHRRGDYPRFHLCRIAVPVADGDDAGLGVLEVQFFVGVAVHQSFLPTEIGYDLLADPHEMQIVEVAATHDQVGQHDVGNCHAPEGNDCFHLVLAYLRLQVFVDLGGQRDTRTTQVQVRAALHL